MVGWMGRVGAWALPLVIAFTVYGSPPPIAAVTPPGDRLLFSLPIGVDGLHRVPGRADQPAWGPSAMAIAPDGSIWFADTAGDRVVGYTREGRRIAAHGVGRRVVGIGDLAVGRHEIAILDIAAARPRVVTIDRGTGRSLSRAVVPVHLGLEAGLSGIGVDPRGGLLLEFEGGNRTSPVDGAATRGTELGRPARDGRFSVEPGRSDRVRSSARVRYGGTSFLVSVPQILGGIYLLAARAGSLDLAVDAMSQEADGTIRVDRTVRRFSSGGRQLGSGRVPLSRDMYVAHALDVAPDGTVVALVARPDRFDVVAVGLGDPPEEILPAAGAFMAEPVKAGTGRGCRDRRMMDHVLSEYLYNSHHLDNGNINGNCPGRMKPRYLGAAKEYASVSYDWGGWDTAAQFNGFMDDGKQAGDIDTTHQVCSRGVDCSGLVSRTWGLATKHSTWALPGVSRIVAIEDLVAYDVFNDAGDHVVHWHVWGNGGLTVSESTTSGRLDRVVRRWVDASYIDGFKPLRYENVC